MVREKELWKNLSKGEVWVKLMDSFGNEKAERIRAGGSIHVSPEERRMNQERSYGPEGDVFANGTLTVSGTADLADTAEDLQELMRNPNSMSESELHKMFEENATKLKKQLAEIDSPILLTRLKEMVEDEEVEVTQAKARAVNERYSEIVPPTTRQKFEDFENPESVKPRKLT